MYLLVVVDFFYCEFILDSKSRFAPVLHCEYSCEIHNVPPGYEKTEKGPCKNPSDNVEQRCEKTHARPCNNEDVFQVNEGSQGYFKCSKHN